MRIVRFPFARCLPLCRVRGDVTDIGFIHYLKMSVSASSAESCTDWNCVQCSRDELRLDVTLASGQSFRLDSCYM